MTKWSRSPSLRFLLLSLLITQVACFQDYAHRMLGVQGKNYNLTKGVPWIGCMHWNATSDPVEAQCDGKDFFGKKLGCQGLVRIKPESLQKYSQRGEEVVIGPDDYETMFGRCWNMGDVSHQQCRSEEQCIAEFDESSGTKAEYAFCCCNTHWCNGNMSVRFKPRNGTIVTVTDDTSLLNDTLTTTTIVPKKDSGISSMKIVLVVVGILIIIISSCCICCFLYFRLKRQRIQIIKTAEEVPLVDVVAENTRRRTLIKEGLTQHEMIAEGKMGRVHKGTYKNPATGQERTVAVKTIQEQKSFLLEESVYLMCKNEHPHLVHYIGSCFEPEKSLYYVVLEHHEMGCLENYLKRETFTPKEALFFLCSFMDGLSFLHSNKHIDYQEKDPLKIKKPIVHRDIKSRNLLMKDDGTAALADFGLAMPVRDCGPQGRRWQVGTHRYMSPEMLAEKANLNMEGLKKVDVYAAALIIWEVLNRTVIDEDDEVQDAKLPYSVELDEEVEKDKEDFERKRINSTDQFQQKRIQDYLKKIVHKDDKRPVIRPRLKKHPITSELVNTALDMWDFEVDGRISAACAHSRMMNLIAENTVADSPVSSVAESPV